MIFGEAWPFLDETSLINNNNNNSSSSNNNNTINNINNINKMHKYKITHNITYVPTCTYVSIYIYTYTYIYISIHIYIYIHIYIHVYIHTHTHIYIYRQIHTYLNVINIWLTNDIYIMISWCSSPQQPRAWTFVQNWHKCSTAPKASKSFERSSKNCGPNWRKSARAGSVCWRCRVCH